MGHGRATSVTAVGDTVNTASRLETLTKEHAYSLLAEKRAAGPKKPPAKKPAAKKAPAKKKAAAE